MLFSSTINKRNQLNSNQHLLRSQRKLSKSQTNTTNEYSSRLISSSQDPTVNVISSTTYPLVNQDLVNYAVDAAFVYSHLSDLSHRRDSSSNYHVTRMSPYAQQTLYPMYTQRKIHSPSS